MANRNGKLNAARMRRDFGKVQGGSTTQGVKGTPADKITVTPEFRIQTSKHTTPPKTKMQPGSTGAAGVHTAH